eukprot:gene29412-58017_t
MAHSAPARMTAALLTALPMVLAGATDAEDDMAPEEAGSPSKSDAFPTWDMKKQPEPEYHAVQNA